MNRSAGSRCCDAHLIPAVRKHCSLRLCLLLCTLSAESLRGLSRSCGVYSANESGSGAMPLTKLSQAAADPMTRNLVAVSEGDRITQPMKMMYTTTNRCLALVACGADRT
jgi:hypothetical protein